MMTCSRRNMFLDRWNRGSFSLLSQFTAHNPSGPTILRICVKRACLQFGLLKCSLLGFIPYRRVDAIYFRTGRTQRSLYTFSSLLRTKGGVTRPVLAAWTGCIYRYDGSNNRKLCSCRPAHVGTWTCRCPAGRCSDMLIFSPRFIIWSKEV